MNVLQQMIERLRLQSLWRAIFVDPRKLRGDILFETLSILFVSIILIIGYNYYSSTNAIYKQAEDYLQSSIVTLRKNISNELAEAEHIVRYYAPLLEQEDLKKVPYQSAMINSLTEVLNTKLQLTSVYFGTPDGFFTEITSPITAAKHFQKLGFKIPESTTSVVKTIDRTTGAEDVNEKWVYIFDYQEVQPPVTGGVTSYDHRKRGWYIEAAKSKVPYWSSVYLFTTIFAGEAGITVAQSLFDNNGKFKGVFAADITLNSLSQFLKDANVSKNSTVYVLDDKNNIISASSIKSNVTLNDKGYEILTVENLGDNVLTKALGLMKGADGLIRFTQNNKEYMVAFNQLQDGEKNHWNAVVIAPMDDFVGYVKENRNTTFIYSLFILIIAFILAYGLAKRISAPIIMLAKEAKKIQELDFAGKLVIDSKITEINMLFEAMASLKNTMQSFSSYIPKTLVRKLIHRKQSVHVGGRNKEVTLMFTDIEGFTSISETIPPEKLIVHLSDYFEEMTGIIMDKNGTVDKYIGDAIMSFWGAPIPDKNQVVHACEAALDCQHRLDELNRVWKREEKPIFNTRIGLHMGEVIIGNIGSSERMNYTAIGDSVNLCSRLEGLNKFYGSNILVSESVYDQVKDTFLFRQLDVVAVKGKNKAVRIYELVAQIKGGGDHLLPTDAQIHFCESFDQAYNMFRTRQWTDAQELFGQIVPISNKDLSVNMYIERCKQFAKSPPPKDWDGTVVMHQK